MAAPTFSSVTPATGLSGGGSLVVITGTGFDVQAVLGDPVPVVSVQFGGLYARDVRVTSPTRLTCLPPRGEIADDQNALAVDVTITNEDQAAPNSVTAAAAYTYRRPDLSENSPAHLTDVLYTLVKRMRQQIIANVAITTHVDYDLSASDLLDRIAAAELPVVILEQLKLDLLPVVNNNEAPLALLPDGDPDPTDFERRDQVRQVNLAFDVRLVTKSEKQLWNLIQAAVAFTQRNEYLADVPRDPFDSGAGVVRYPLSIVDDFAVAGVQSRANVREAVGSWLIEGVLLENGDLIEAAPTVDEFVLTTRQLP
jgi:IPT/TIG domain